MTYHSSTDRIPLERGRDVAAQYGVAPLLAPLFDHVPNNTMMGALPHQLPMRIPGNIPPMPFPNMRPPHYMIRYMPPNMLHGVPPMFAPGGPMYPPYQQMPGPPGSQPRMQMYAPQPLPPGAHQMHQQAMMNPFISSNANASAPSSSGPAQPSINTHTESHPSLKRIREEEEPEPMLSQDTDITMVDGPDDDVFSHPGPAEGPPPPKKARTDGGPTNGLSMRMDVNGTAARSPSPITTIDPKRLLTAFPPTTILPASLEPSDDEMMPRPSTISTANRLETRDAVRRSTLRATLLAAIQEDVPDFVVRLLLEQNTEPMLAASDINAIIDDKGHTALHVAAALGKLAVVEALVSRGADVHRGNYRGETALMRAVLKQENYEAQTFEALLKLLRQSIRTTDEFKKSVLHHISHVAALDRVAEANYYLLTILLWIGKHQGGNSDTLIDLKDVNGDTALNIASRLGMNSLVEALITAGADISSFNKFGISPLDYGVINAPQVSIFKAYGLKLYISVD
jgi:regulatory protein SWI6